VITASSDHSNNGFIGGGEANTIDSSAHSVISGGCKNLISQASAFSGIVSGRDHTIRATSDHSTILGGRCNTISAVSIFSTITNGVGNILQAAPYGTAGGFRALSHVQGQRSYAGQNWGGTAGEFQSIQWTATTCSSTYGCVELFVDASCTRFVMCPNSIVSGIMTISNIYGNKSSQFTRQIHIQDIAGTSSVLNCQTIGTDFDAGGFIGAPTIDIANDNEISITVCSPENFRTMSYFSGIEIITPA
jgi:hypothetical protein